MRNNSKKTWLLIATSVFALSVFAQKALPTKEQVWNDWKNHSIT